MWREVSRVDAQARALADRHYSRQTHGHREFMPPGETFVLVMDGAVWGAVRNIFAGKKALRCSIFRNESPELSSRLVSIATALTYRRFPGDRLKTEVLIDKVRPKRHPGYAFRCAGWISVRVARSKVKGGGLMLHMMAPPANAIDEYGELL